MIHIDIFHDTVCPWCRIGKQNLKLALERWQGDPVTIAFHSFFLDPTIPLEGRDFKAHMMAKGNGRIPLRQWFDRPTQLGAQVGLTFNFDDIQYAPNSLLSHSLIALTPPEKQEAVVDAVYKAYFEDGRNIGDLDTLLAIAEEQGLETAGLREKLQGTAVRDEVLVEAEWAQQQGIHSVPFFIFNNRYAFSGAQPPPVFLQVLEKVKFENERGLDNNTTDTDLTD